MSAIRRFLMLVVLGGCAFVLSKGLLNIFLLPDPPPYGGNSTTRLILTVGYLGVAITLLSCFRETLFVVRRNWLLAALVVLTFVSCLWAESPAFVLQRSTAVFGATLLGLALAARLSLEEQLRLMSWVFRIMGVLSLAFVLFLPGDGISQSGDTVGQWQGIFGYKNLLGAMMALSILVEWHRPAYTRYAKITKGLALLISAVLLVFSNSVTPLLALTGSLLFVEIFRFAHQRLRIPSYAIILAILLIIGSGLTVLLVDNDSVIGALGRSANLTGRTEIWSLVLSKISERPVLGYGYSGFWYGSSSESFAVDQAFGFGTAIMYSHNGYLETLLSLGAVGFLLALGFLGTGMKRAYECSELGGSSVNLWPLAFLLFFLLYNLGECTILLQDLQWAICVSVVVSADAALRAPDAEALERREQEEESLYLPVHDAT